MDSKTMLLIGDEALLTGETGSVSGYGVEVPGEHDKMENGNEELGEEMMVDFDIEVEIPKVFPRCATPGDCVSLIFALESLGL